MFLPFARGVCGGLSVRDVAKRCVVVAAAVISFDTAAAVSESLPLYDAASAVLPDASPWSWTYGSDSSGSSRNMTPSLPLAAVLDTRLSAGAAGYGKIVGAGLDSSTGFVIDFSLRVVEETHANGDLGTRSGFSIIVLDQAKKGVELSFWTNQVFAKIADYGFPHGDGISVDAQTSARNYRVTFLSGQYTLVTEGAPPLAGVLSNYAPFVQFPYNVVPYGQANYIFFGDNTTSASALVELSSITLAPVPEPGEWALMAAGLVCIAGAVRRRRRGMPAAC